MTYLDVLADHGLEPIETSGGTQLAIHCPLCESTGRKLYINAKTGAWLCFVCEESGGPYRLLREVLEIEHFQARRLLDKIEQGKPGPRPLTPRPVETPTPEGITIPKDIHPLTDPAGPGQEPFFRYLHDRGVSLEDMRRYRMGFCLRGLYAYRVIIPVYSEGTMWTFIARSILPGVEPKVLHPQGAKPGHALFNIDNIQTGVVFLVEGVFDALRLRTNTVASLGTNLSAHQRDLLRRKGVETVIILWDGDEPGRHGAARIADQLRAAMFNVQVALLPDGQDPASASWQDLHTAIHEANAIHYPPLSARLSADRLDARAPK